MRKRRRMAGGPRLRTGDDPALVSDARPWLLGGGAGRKAGGLARAGHDPHARAATLGRGRRGAATGRTPRRSRPRSPGRKGSSSRSRRPTAATRRSGATGAALAAVEGRGGSAISPPRRSMATGRADGWTRRASSRRSPSAGAGGWRRRRRGWRAGCRCMSSGSPASTGRGGARFDKLREGRAHRVVKPGQVFSRIHVDDIAGVLLASMARPDPGRAYNVADDEPAPPQDVIAYAAGLLGVPVPPEVPFAAGGALAHGAELLRRVRSGWRTGGSRRSWGCGSPGPTIAPGSRRSWRRGSEGRLQQPGGILPPNSRSALAIRRCISEKICQCGIRRRRAPLEVGWMQRKPLRAGVAMLALTAVASVAPGTTAPAQETAPPRPSLNLYGVTGLIDMPSAESQPDAQVSASYSQFGETSRRNFTFQLLPRVSATLRYSTIRNWGNDEDPDYNLFDRSIDVQFQLLKEKGWQPSLARRLPRPHGHRGLFRRVPRRHQDHRAGLHRHRRRRLGAARQRRRGGEPVLLDLRQLLHPRRPTSARAGTSSSTRSSTARRWASSAASSGGRRSTS